MKKKKFLIQKGLTIKGPKVDAPKIALEGFLRSNNLVPLDIFEQDTNKGRFFFAKTRAKSMFSLQDSFFYLLQYGHIM